jgi:Mitochondrial carrier protein
MNVRSHHEIYTQFSRWKCSSVETNAYKNIMKVAGSLCGVMGAMSPFELVKTRLQSPSSSSLAAGHKHGYSGVWNSLTTIHQKDRIKGMYRGSVLSMSRSILGSGANLTSYSLMKEHLTADGRWKEGVVTDMVCGMESGLVSWDITTKHTM